tara:strand:+ start:1106 stop:2356 length:1251 start_codon:yes stop_codon:yes gene_type:complete
MNSFNDWLHKIQGLTSRKIKPDLNKVKSIFRELCKFSSKTKIIIVTGTNGKGTTIELITQMLLNNGKRVGTYTSPHLFHFSERIRVNGKKVTEGEIVNELELIEEKKGNDQLTFFEYSTLAALSLFSKKDLDYLVLEVGIGGRLDTVNIMDADVSIVTNIDLDHQRWLGKDLESIGREKSGIFRKNRPVVLGLNMPSSILKRAEELSCPTYALDKEFLIQQHENSIEYLNILTKRSLSFSFTDNFIYLHNLAIAIKVLDLLNEDLDLNLEEITQLSKLPGRCELFEGRYLMDVSHNPSSVMFLRKYLDTGSNEGKKVFAVLGVGEEKDANGMIDNLKGRVNEWFVAEPQMQNPLKIEKISNHLIKLDEKFTLFSNIRDALHEADSKANENSIVLVFGSFYTVSEAYFHLQKKKEIA